VQREHLVEVRELDEQTDVAAGQAPHGSNLIATTLTPSQRERPQLDAGPLELGADGACHGHRVG
jgi:hypothetical protein